MMDLDGKTKKRTARLILFVSRIGTNSRRWSIKIVVLLVALGEAFGRQNIVRILG